MNETAAATEDPGYAMAVEHKAVLIERQVELRKYLEQRLWAADRAARSCRDRGESDAAHQLVAGEIEGVILRWREITQTPLSEPIPKLTTWLGRAAVETEISPGFKEVRLLDPTSTPGPTNTDTGEGRT